MHGPAHLVPDGRDTFGPVRGGNAVGVSDGVKDLSAPRPVERGTVELGRVVLERMDAVSSSIDVRELDAREVLMREGESADAIFVLIEGSLEVSKKVGSKKATLAQLDVPGTVVGEMVSMGGGQRTATVTATEPSRVYHLSPSRFHGLLSDPEFENALSSAAVRRAEEAELAELLVRSFGISQSATVASACSAVTWRTLEPGETLVTQGEESKHVFFVIRGRLRSEQVDPGSGETLTVGIFAKGDVIGELGVLSANPRIASVVALRHTVVAVMEGPDFVELTETRPRLLVDLALSAVARFAGSTPRNSPATIIALAAPAMDRSRLIEDLRDELAAFGAVETLSVERVDSVLETPGIANSSAGELGDVRVSRLVHEVELQSDHLLIDIGDEDSAWAQRSLGLADRILIVVPRDLGAEDIHRLRSLLTSCPSEITRTLVVEHPDRSTPHGTARLAGDLSCSDVLQVVKGVRSDLSRIARVAAGRANALVIGGGGARGFAHIGAYRALIELGIPVDLVAGTSIGGVLGSVIADAADPAEVVKMAEDHFSRVLDYTIPVVSLIKGEKIQEAARAHFGDRHIEDLRKTFFCVSTDLTTSRPHLHRSGELVAALRATSAIPGVMPPVPMGDALLVDGGVLNNLPMDVARLAAPAGRVFAFDVAPPRGPGAHGDYGLSVSGWKALRSRRGPERSPYPRIFSVLMRSMITASMQERDRQINTDLADFYINLDVRGTSMLDFSNPAAIADRGYEAALPALQGWLGEATEG